MIAAICCPGQSLMKTWPSAPIVYDLVIAVNSAAKLVAADWIAASDKSWYRGLLPADLRPRCGFCCMDDAVGDCRAFAPGCRVVAWDDIPLVSAQYRAGRPMNWTVQVALGLAQHFGAHTVDLYGADGRYSTSTVDAAGYAGEDRTAERWEREERDLAYTTDLLLSQGCTVNRILWSPVP